MAGELPCSEVLTFITGNNSIKQNVKKALKAILSQDGLNRLSGQLINLEASYEVFCG